MSLSEIDESVVRELLEKALPEFISASWAYAVAASKHVNAEALTKAERQRLRSLAQDAERATEVVQKLIDKARLLPTA